MVQHRIESKFSEYGLPNTDNGKPNHDKKLLLPMTTKKTVLRGLWSENRSDMPKSVESSIFSKENGGEIESIKVSVPIRTEPVNHSQPISAANGHLVYVRRRPEVDPPKSSIYASTSDGSFCSLSKKVGDQLQKIEEMLQVKEPPICISDIVPISACSLTSFLSGKQSVPSSTVKLPNNLQATGSENRGVSKPPIALSDYRKQMNRQHWEQRYCQLQGVLEILDRSNQENYIQMLRSLPSEGLSSQAIGLEKRSIQLSLEEAKELQRVQQLDVLRKNAKTSRVPAAQRG